MKSVFSMFAYWDRIHQFPDGHIKVKNNLAWRRKYLHVLSRNKQLIFQRMKKETRNVVVLDLEDKIKLQKSISDLEEVAETYQRPCKELTCINNILYYLKTIEEKIDQRMKIRLAKKIMKQARHLSTASDYWYRRLRDFEYKICYGFVGKKDHRITKAISLTSKKK